MSENHIQDWDHFIEISRNFEKAEKIYRGQADSSWRLRPSLIRVLKDNGVNREKALEIERILLEDFKNNNPDKFIDL